MRYLGKEYTKCEEMDIIIQTESFFPALFLNYHTGNTINSFDRVKKVCLLFLLTVSPP